MFMLVEKNNKFCIDIVKRINNLRQRKIVKRTYILRHCEYV